MAQSSFRKGDRVFTSDGEELGRIKEVQDTCIFIAAPNRRDFWLARDAGHSDADGVVILSLDKDHLSLAAIDFNSHLGPHSHQHEGGGGKFGALKNPLLILLSAGVLALRDAGNRKKVQTLIQEGRKRLQERRSSQTLQPTPWTDPQGALTRESATDAPTIVRRDEVGARESVDTPLEEERERPAREIFNPAAIIPGTGATGLDLIRKDHEAIRTLMDLFPAAASATEKVNHRDSLFLALQTHTILEREVFYPWLSEIGLGKSYVESAEAEHDAVDVLMRELAGAGSTESDFAAKMLVLKDMVVGHLDKEEGLMLEFSEHASPEALEALTRRLEDHRTL